MHLNNNMDHIKNLRTFISNWLPALLIMLVIFWFSAQPSSELPTFNWADKLLKKGGHMLGYAFLAFSYWRALDFKPGKRWLAWLFAVIYAVTDEFHQSFVPGRHPSSWDIALFDNFGALLSLWFAGHYRKQKRPDSVHPAAKITER